MKLADLFSFLSSLVVNLIRAGIFRPQPHLISLAKENAEWKAQTE